MAVAALSRTAPAPIQTVTWIRPSAPRPRILPASSWVGLMDDSRISMIRPSFSSLTPWSRNPDVVKMVMTKRIEKA